VELSSIKGLGPAKQDALRQAGYGSVEDLAAIDLRKNVEVQGVSPDNLKVLKQRARRLLAAEGKPVPKAPYSRHGKARSSAESGKPAKAAEPAAPVVKLREKPKGAKPGFLRRLLTRRQ
jgi:hypothetical protein